MSTTRDGLARLRRRLRRAGYTMVEVMMAIAVLAIGLLAIAALQTSTVSGNIQAQETTMATSLARVWVERLRRDATRWTLGRPPPLGSSCGNPLVNNICTTRYLGIVATMDAAGAAQWRLPPAGAPMVAAGDPYTTTYGFQSPAFDHHGRDVAPTNAAVRYCTHIRIGWVYRGSTVRADVRVFWHKRFRNRGNVADPSPARIACTPADVNRLNVAATNLAGRAALFRNVSAVYVSTLLRYSPTRF